MALRECIFYEVHPYREAWGIRPRQHCRRRIGSGARVKKEPDKVDKEVGKRLSRRRDVAHF
jgi:hypothetical protein